MAGIRSSGDLTGDHEVIARLRAQVAGIVPVTERAVSKAGLLVERNIKLLLGLKSHPPNTPTPSRPGEPPALITGDLRRSVRTRTENFTATISTGLVYSRIQEYGGAAGRGHRSILPPRPYMRPGLEMSRPDINSIMASAWRDYLD